MNVTAIGWQALDDTLAADFEPPEALRSRLSPVLAAGLYDTAIREMSVSLEIALRAASSAPGAFGQPLEELYCQTLTKRRTLPPALVKVLRGDLRTAFRFVRNEYAHDNPPTSRARGLSLLVRMAELYTAVVSLSTPAPRDGTSEGVSAP